MVNPVLCIHILDTRLSLRVLDVLDDAGAGQLYLFLKLCDDFLLCARYSGL